MKTIYDPKSKPLSTGGKRKYLIIVLTLLSWLALHGQELAIGNVVFGEEQQAIPGYPVLLVYEDLEEEVFTNEDGFFSGPLLNANGSALQQVGIVDFCTGVQIVEEVIPDSAFFFFHLCAELDTPPGVVGCEAFFHYEQVSFGPDYSILFQNLSFSSEMIDTLLWEFGDGNSSDQFEPVHTYQEPGEYEVTLSIYADSCQSTFTAVVQVRAEGDCVCDAVYIPTCVLDDSGERLFFSNPCLALCAGYTQDQFVACEDECGCPEYYDPVCAVVEGDTLQFSNICFAACEGFTEADVFACFPDTTICGCPEYYDPVCAVVEGDTLQFSNICFAVCEGFTEADVFACNPDTTICGCPAIYDPVCVLLPDGTIQTYGNACEAFCDGVVDPIFVPCEGCVCPDIYDPVCVWSASGELLTFGNSCEAECAGFGPWQWMDCEDPDPCICPEIFLPVCTVTETGDTLTFPNACFANCEGYPDSLLFECELYPSDCECDDEYWPVCTYDATGVLITYPNMCQALCEGVDPAQLFPCDTIGNPCDTILIPCDTLGIVCDTIILPCDTTGLYCQAEFVIDYSGPESLEVLFQDFSYSIEGEIVGWKWDFGDGNTSEEQNPVHVYDSGGIYEVVLSIETSSGCASSLIQHLCIGDDDIVEGPECQAIFFFEQLDEEGAFHFQDVSLGEVISWQWNFGDGNTSEEPVPVHRYEEPGVYVVTLTIETASGCSSSISVILTTADNILYEDECRALFLPFINPDSLQVFFLNLSSADVTTVLWDFGDGNTSNEFIPSHVYAAGGVYTVTLTISTENGCENTYSAIINLESNDFTASPSFRIVSNTEEQEKATPQTTLDHLMPNPVRDELTIVVTAEQRADYQMQVFSLQGQLLQQLTGDLLAGENRLLLGVGSLPEGMYLLRIQTKGEELTRKFVKQ